MKTMLRSIILIVLTGLCLSQNVLFAYDNFKAHPALNAAMVNYAEVFIKSSFPEGVSLAFSTDPNQYSGSAVTNPGKTVFDYGESTESKNAVEWIKHGGFAADEPELAAAVRHFYDPVGLIAGKKWLTDRGTYWEGAYSIPMNPETDAIEWALGDTPKGSANRWTWVKAKESLVDALELADESMKKSNLAKAFRSLGEVLHNTGDMGCPPHTRNDSHAAPLGFSGGAVLGSPDPYEELFKPEWALMYIVNTPDPELQSFFASATTIRSIDEKLAAFTNENFITEQTINGRGRGIVTPINEQSTYASPDLMDMDYKASEYIYYKTFPSGNRVKMCSDKHGYIVNYRGYPRIDAECVQSQAQELVPDLLCAGAHIIRLFIPKLKVEITEAKIDGTVKGRVVHTKTAEYDETIYYNGKIVIYNDVNGKTLATVNCSTGDFSGTITGLKENDELIAKIELGGIIYSSMIYKIKNTVNWTQYNTISIKFEANMPVAGSDPFTGYFYISNATPPISTKPSSPLIWAGTSFSCSFDMPWGGSLRDIGTISGQISADGKTLTSLTAENRTEGAVVYWIDRIQYKNMPLVENGNRDGYSCEITGPNVQNHLVSVYRAYCQSGFPCQESSTVDWNSPPEPLISVDIYFNDRE